MTTPSGFGKGVNDYFNHYITLADAKAAGFIAAALSVGAAVLKFQNTAHVSEVLRWLATIALGGSVAACARVVFPRLPSGRRGVIFWEDVRTFKGHEDYQRAVESLSDTEVETEYACQNYFVSEVLHKKHYWVRWGISLFLVGTGLAVIAFVVR